MAKRKITKGNVKRTLKEYPKLAEMLEENGAELIYVVSGYEGVTIVIERQRNMYIIMELDSVGYGSASFIDETGDKSRAFNLANKIAREGYRLVSIVGRTKWDVWPTVDSDSDEE